jgi:phosphoenolpyruvate carboxykinase (ATP)
MSDTTKAGAGPLGGTGCVAEQVHENFVAPQLVAAALQRGEGVLSEDGALVVRTGSHTGRSAADKYIVDEPQTTGEIWWGKVNQRLDPAKFAGLAARVRDYLQTQVLFTQDLYAGADVGQRVRVRLVTTGAWHALFARNMFIRPPAGELADFVPDYVILHAPGFEADPAVDGVRSSTVIALSFALKTIVIVGTEYAGEIKKSIFTVMNWLLPQAEVMPMHCSANIGPEGDVALFFGLSGTGKTTLSSDPSRRLIGDDEHGWGPDGVFNVEGGCYAKVIDLSAEAEPQIWAASHRFGAVVENVVTDAAGRLQLGDRRYTENTRSCYPIAFIAGAELSGRGGQPRNVIMLTADAFGVLPPVSRLTPAQAMYHFLSGYTARIAGTEQGTKEPEATFSACFAAPFLPRPPEVYGQLLAALLVTHGADCWLINTGWTGGSYGVGQRMSIRYTRAIVAAVLDGSLARGRFVREGFFGLMIPAEVEGVPSDVLQPNNSWASQSDYARTASALVARFERNFAGFAADVGPEVRAAGLRAAA